MEKDFSNLPSSLYQLDHQKIFRQELRVIFPNTPALFSAPNSLPNSYLTLQDFIHYFVITTCTTSTVDQAIDVVSLQTSQGCKPNYYQFINSLQSLSNFASTNSVSISAICRSVDACSILMLPSCICSHKNDNVTQCASTLEWA